MSDTGAFTFHSHTITSAMPLIVMVFRM